MSTNWLVGVVIVLIVALGGYVLTHGGAQGAQGPQGVAGENGSNGADGQNGKDGKNSQSFGAVTGPDSYFDCETHNGLTKCFARTALRTATTTPAAMRSPRAASSTLVFAACQINTASATAITWTEGKATTAYATTTNLNGQNIVTAANAQDYIQASTSPTSTKSNIFAPGAWFVLSETGGITVGDAAGTGFVPAGSCSAEWDY